MVVLAHANLLIDSKRFGGWFIQGYCGVDFFFVLSGFIIFYANHSDIGNRERLPIYLYKRFVRVYPVYWLYTALVLVANFALLHLLHKHLVSWVGLNLSNLLSCLLLYPTNVAANVMPVLPVAWTLSYEVFFYAAFSLLIAVGRRYSIPILSAWALCSVGNLAIHHHYGNLFINLAMSSRNVEFLFGAAIAYFTVKSRRTISSSFFLVLLAVGAGLLSVSWSNAHEGIHADPTISFGVPFSLILLSLIGLERSGMQIRGVWGYLGDASYSIYLLHYLLIVVLADLFLKAGFRNSYLEFAAIASICIAVGCLSYAFIEAPLVKRLRPA